MWCNVLGRQLPQRSCFFGATGASFTLARYVYFFFLIFSSPPRSHKETTDQETHMSQVTDGWLVITQPRRDNNYGRRRKVLAALEVLSSDPGKGLRQR
jgi:DNA-binding MurR/RpiR family transcriptional regulator